MVLVRQRTQLKNRLHATLAKYALHDFTVSDVFGVRGRELLRQRIELLPAHTAYASEHLLRQVEELGGQIRQFEQRIQATFRPTPAIQQLMTVPGVGLTLAVVIALEVGDVARFATAEKLAGDAGTTPRVHASGGKTRFGRSRPDVNRYLKWAFVEAANAICVTRRRSPSAMSVGLRPPRPAQGPPQGYRGVGPASGRSDVLDPEQTGTLSRTEDLDRVVHGG